MADAAESRKIGMIYARVSSEEQRKGWSTDVQINSGLQLFAELGVTVPDELIFNDGVSGDFPNRKGYQRLRQAVRERKGNFVYSQYSDRLARTWWQQGEFAADCYRHGVGLYIGNELVNDSRISKFMFGVRSVMDEDAKAILLERTRLGKEQRAKTGLPPGGTVPYGYDVVHHAPRRSEWLKNERESQVVRQIYEWYVKDGMSILSIAKRLSAAPTPIPTKADITQKPNAKKRPYGTWSYSSVRHILTQPAYTGRAHQQRVKVIERSLVITEDGQERMRAKRARRAEAEQIVFTVPQIITQEIFDAAQSRLARNKELSRRNMHHAYLLRPRWFRCSCGQSMTGLMRHGVYKYYRCYSRLSRNFGEMRCPGMIRANEAEKQILSKC
jgi:site-specific DNA recombinase